MAQKVLKVGSSIAVTIPKKLAEELNWKPGDNVAVKGDVKQRRVTYYSPREPLSTDDLRVAELAYKFLQRYRKDFEALAHR